MARLEQLSELFIRSRLDHERGPEMDLLVNHMGVNWSHTHDADILPVSTQSEQHRARHLFWCRHFSGLPSGGPLQRSVRVHSRVEGQYP